jgi:predicted GIY-YIG superfamily endonuclease
VFSFYLVRCSDDSLYAGYCRDLTARIAKHNTGKGAKYTRARLPVTLVHHENFRTQSRAMRREAEVKKWTRIEKLQLLNKKR